MATMPTPASTFSAYGRRRHILQDTPSTSVIAPKTAAPSTTRQPPQRTIWRAPTPPSLPPTLFKKLSPLLTFTETTILQSLLLTLATVLLTLLLKQLISIPAFLLNRCKTLPPVPTHPFTALLLRIFTIPFLTLSLATRQLLSRTPNATQAIGTTVTAILQTTLLSFVALGSTPPHPYLLTACVPSNSAIFPSWPDLLPQLLHAVIAAPLYHLLSRHAAPPPSMISRRPYRRAVALPAIPALLATIPASLIPLFTLLTGYKPFLRSLGAVNSAFITTFATLISWSAQTALHETSATMLSPELERDRLGDLLREDAPSNLVLPSLRAITTSNNALYHFPGYTDATGTAWRAILAHCLHPLSTVRTALQHRPTVTLFASSAPAWRIVLPHEEVRHAIMACTSLARVYEECLQADTFGVVHRTLPFALGELLRCKVETAGFVAESGVEWGEGLRRRVGVCSGRDMVAAVDDALSVCVYRIVGAFKGHLETYIRGGEVEWDHGLNGLLQAFLEYQVP